MVIHISQDREILGRVCGLENVPFYACLWHLLVFLLIHHYHTVAISNIVVLCEPVFVQHEQHSLALSIRLAPTVTDYFLSFSA